MAYEDIIIIPDNTDELLYVKITHKDAIKYCGYRKNYLSQNLSEMEQELIVCKVCTGILREPSLYKSNTTCLVCSEMPEELNSVKGIQTSVSKLDIKCPTLRDCNWNGKLSEVSGHLEICLCFLIECTKCKRVVQRREKINHEANLCEMRQLVCKYKCGKVGLAKNLEKHFKFCDNYPLLCPNNCGVNLIRKQVSAHKTECDLEKVSCPYAEYGCEAKSILNRDLLAHKKDRVVEHTDLCLKRIKMLEKEKDEMKLELQVIQNPNIVVPKTFKRPSRTSAQVDQDPFKIPFGKPCFYSKKK